MVISLLLIIVPCVFFVYLVLFVYSFYFYRLFGFVNFPCLFYLVVLCFFLVGYCLLVFVFCYLFFVFFQWKILLPRFWSIIYPIPTIDLGKGIWLFLFASLSKSFEIFFEKVFCFKIEVFSFQYHVPEMVVLLIFILSWIA